MTHAAMYATHYRLWLPTAQLIARFLPERTLRALEDRAGRLEAQRAPACHAHPVGTEAEGRAVDRYDKVADSACVWNRARLERVA